MPSHGEHSTIETRLLLLAGVLVISFSAIFVRLARVSPATAAFFRSAYAWPILWAVWLARRDRDRRDGRARRLAVLSGLVLAVDLTLWHAAIASIGAGLATVLANTQVVLVGLFGWVVYRERPTTLALITVPLVLAGVTLISGLGRPDAYGDDPVRGALLGTLAGASYAGFLLTLRAASRPGADALGPLTDCTLGAALGALVVGFVVDPRFTLAVSWPSHGWLIVLAVMSQIVGWLLLTTALPRLPALDASAALLGQPMLTMLWAFLLFGEAVSVVQWAGVAIVLGGVGALTRRGTVHRSTPAVAAAEPALPSPASRRERR